MNYIFLLVLSFVQPSYGHPGHSGAHLSLGSSAHRPSDLPPHRVKLKPVIVVKRRFFPDAGVCLAKFQNNHCSVTDLMLEYGPEHPDYQSYVLIKLTDRTVTFTALSHGYMIEWLGPTTTPLEDKKRDIVDAVALLKDSRPRREFATIRYRAATEKEASLSPGSVLQSGTGYEEVFLGRALGVRRKIAIRAESCEKTLNQNECRVSVVAHENPDHPGSPWGSVVASASHTFADGSSVKMESGSNYESYFIRYTPASTAEPAGQALSKITEALKVLKGAEKDFYLTVYAFTPNDPAKFGSESYVSGVILDETLGNAVYGVDKILLMSFDECREQYQTASRSCSVTKALQDVPSEKPLIDHLDDWEVKEIGFSNLGKVRFEMIPGGYWAGFFPSQNEDGLSFIEKAFRQLDETEDSSLGVCRIKAY